MTGPASPRENLAVLVGFAARVLRGWRVGAGLLALGLLATVGLTLSTHRLYRSEALLTYEGAAQVMVSGDGISQRTMAARVYDMVTSRQRIEKLIKDMKLYRGVVDKRGMVEAIDEMRKHLKVSSGEGFSYRISYDGDGRDLTRDALESLLDDVITEDRQRHTRQVEETQRFLDHEKQLADEEVKTKEGALSAFLAKHPQLANEAGAASVGGLLRAADRDKAAASGGDVASLELQAAQIEESLAASTHHPVALGGPLDDPQLAAALTRAETELAAARSDLLEKQAHLTNEHPDVKMAMRRVTVAELAAKHAEAAMVAGRAQRPAAVKTEVAEDDDVRTAALKRALAAVRQQLAASRGHGTPHEVPPKNAGSLVAIDTEWLRLNREASEARDRQTQLQSKQFQAELASALTSAGDEGQLVIVDHPYRPLRPVAGGHAKVLAAGAVGSLLLALFGMGVFALFDDHLYAAGDVQRVLGDGFVVVVPVGPKMLAPQPAVPENAGDDTGGRAGG
ncbi:MAG TPA: hypothetical protein VN853_00705 [Polyangia bacterium]|nr:hypothetical protein [Polyangia bacterium]